MPLHGDCQTITTLQRNGVHRLLPANDRKAANVPAAKWSVYSYSSFNGDIIYIIA